MHCDSEGLNNTRGGGKPRFLIYDNVLHYVLSGMALAGSRLEAGDTLLVSLHLEVYF